MSVNHRIKEIRLSLGFNQKDFGEQIGLKKSAASWMEKTGNTITEQNKKIICDKFHVSKQWLETGEGEMKVPDAPSDDIFVSLRDELKLSDVEEKILRNYFDLDIKSRKAVVDFIYKIGSSLNKSSTSEEEKWQAKRKALHDQLDAELDAEEKGQSASDSGNFNTGKRA